MPQDDSFVTPTMPTPTTTPVQDDSMSDQSILNPARNYVTDETSTVPTEAAPTEELPTSTMPVETAPVDPAPAAPTNPEPTAAADPVPSSDAVVMPDPEPAVATPAISPSNQDVYTEVATKIGESKNFLIALSSDPSVDELSAAIGLSLYLDRIGKRATAIYSGSTPNALEFLKPEETFETTPDTLQDFVIALNKEKADHLRYKLDGEYVKVYITPYRHRITQEDLEFSYGDYNVDLVIALDVANGIDLDAALREHGRIMHDAVIINATTGNPGKFGEIEWSDKTASSVSEMIATLLYNYGGEDPIAKDEATAYLTGIVAATNRFANAKTTPATMRLCSKLMESGANQQLVSKNITPDIDNELIGFAPTAKSEPSEKPQDDPTKLDIEHEYETRGKTESDDDSTEKREEVSTEVTKKEHTLLDDLKAAEQSLAQASAETVPDDNSAALEIDSHSSSDDDSPTASKTESSKDEPSTEKSSTTESTTSESSKTETSAEEKTASESSTTTSDSEPVLPEPVASELESTKSDDEGVTDKPETVVAPSSDFNSNELSDDDATKYGQMLQDALDSINNMPAEPDNAITSTPDPSENPALANAPSVSSSPEINGVPEMNYMPMPGTEILPPPPTPPIGMPQDATGPDTSLPIAGAPTTPLGSQPAMQDQVYRPQVADPSAFKIPGM